MSLENLCLLARGHVPDPQRFVSASADNPRPIRAEGHAEDAMGVPLECAVVLVEPRKQVIVLPAAQVSAAAVQQFPGATRVACLPFPLGRGDLVDIKLPLGPRELFFGTIPFKLRLLA